MKSINENSNFYITNSISEVLSGTKWSVHETKLMLLVLHKLDDYRVFLKKSYNEKYNITGTDVFLDTIDSNELDLILTDIPKAFSITRDEFLSVTLVDQSHAAREIKKVCEKLIDKKSITPNPLDYNNPKSFRLLNWFSRIEYNDKLGIIHIDLNSFILKYLIVMTQYTKIDFVYISLITNEYALKLYLHCKIGQRVYNGRIENKERLIHLTIDEFKKLLNLDGKYQKVSMLKAGVLDVAMSQINEFTDLNINYELMKSGNKYHEINIIFSAKKTTESSGLKDSKSNSAQADKKENIINYEKVLENELLNFGVSKNRIDSLLSEYTADEIYQAIDALKLEISKNKSFIRNIAGYLVKCIHNTKNKLITSSEIYKDMELENKSKEIELKNKSKQWDLFEQWCLNNENKINSLYLNYSENKKNIPIDDVKFANQLGEQLIEHDDFVKGAIRPIPSLILGSSETYNGKTISIQLLNKIAQFNMNYEL